MKTVKDAMDALGISRPTLVDWCDRKLIKFSTRKRGMFEERVFADKEIARVKALLKERQPGKALHPALDVPRK